MFEDVGVVNSKTLQVNRGNPACKQKQKLSKILKVLGTAACFMAVNSIEVCKAWEGTPIFSLKTAGDEVFLPGKDMWLDMFHNVPTKQIWPWLKTMSFGDGANHVKVERRPFERLVHWDVHYVRIN